MKFIKKCPLFLLILVTALLFTGMAVLGRNTVYANYTYEPTKAPALSLFFMGIRDGIFPFEKEEQPQEQPQPEKEETVVSDNEGEEITETETAEEKEEEPVTYTFEQAEEDYFDDALFIGDSRTVGLWEYAGIEERAEFYCKTSLTIWDVLEKPIVQRENGEKITVEQALTEEKFGKIYLMVGINELGRGNVELFMEQYEKVVARIRELQPDAILYVQGIMRVGGKKNQEDAIFNNTNINMRNERIALLADNHDIFYIDVNEAVCDENGNLQEEYTFDQIHLKAAYYQIWKEFLLEHAILNGDGSN